MLLFLLVMTLCLTLAPAPGRPRQVWLSPALLGGVLCCGYGGLAWDAGEWQKLAFCAGRPFLGGMFG